MPITLTDARPASWHRLHWTLAGVALLSTSLAPLQWPDRLLLVLATLAIFWLGRRQLRQPALHITLHPDSGAWVGSGDSDQRTWRLRQVHFSGRQWICLGLQAAGGNARRMITLPAASNRSDDFRRLRVWLRGWRERGQSVNGGRSSMV